MRVYTVLKRVLDICFALLLLAVSSPVLLVTAFLIAVSSPGGILFKQKRPGKNGEIFTIYKFRTMHIITDQNSSSLSDTKRTTRVGRWLRKLSLDELPQIINILRGEMSFIGPRPLLPEYLDRYTQKQMRRHNVLPGISGWAQVNGRNQLSWDEKFEFDLYYVDNYSFKLDCKIFFLTFINILLPRSDVNHSKTDTMPVFINEIRSNAEV